MGLVKKGLLWGLMHSTSFLIGIAVVGFLFAKYPKQYTAALKFNQQWVGDPLGWLLGWVPVIGDHLEAFLASHGAGVALLIGEVAFVAKLVILAVSATFAARFLRRRSAAVANPANPLQPVSATQTEPGNGDRVMLKTIVTLIAAAATLAAAAIAPVDYIESLRSTPIGMVVYTFVMYASAIYIGYVLFNIFSGLLGQGDAGRAPALYWIDYVPSWLAWLSFNAVGLWVALGSAGTVRGFTPITKLADMPNDYWVLIGLVIFSWLDVGILQGHKHKAAWQYIRTQRTIAPPPAVAPLAVVVPPPAALPGPAPVAVPITEPASLGNPLFVVLGLLLVVVLLIVLFSGNWPVRNDAASTRLGSYYSGWKTDINHPLGPEWRDVTRR